jgi:alpha-tubulin suppressor-like RCC1 family protein
MKATTLVCAALMALGLGVAALPAGAATEQTTYSWGTFGEDGHVSPKVATPTVINGTPADIVQMVATNAATYELTASGQVWAFGANRFGELGNGTTTDSFTTPVEVQFPAGVTIASLPSPMPYATGMAIDTTGHAWGWGINQHGELCLGAADQETTPVKLPLPDVTLATGAGGHASYYAAGHIYSCGQNQFGQLGNGSTRDSKTPRVVHTAGPVVGLYSGFGFTGALLKDGTYWDWGLNKLGQLGLGNTTNQSSPQQVQTGSSPVVFATVGANDDRDGQTFAILANGDLLAWGDDKDGQLCDKRKTPSVASPEDVKPPAPMVSAASGGKTSYLLDTSGNLWACGYNHGGEIGDGKMGRPLASPVKVLSGVAMVSSTSENEAVIEGGSPQPTKHPSTAGASHTTTG